MDIKKVVLTILLAAFINSLIGMLQYYGFAEELFNQRAKPASTFVNKNFATPLIAFSIPLYLVFIAKLKQKLWLILASIAFAFSLSYLFVAFTRASILALILSILITFIIILFSKSLQKETLKYKLFNKYKYFIIIIIIVVLLISAKKFQEQPTKMHSNWEIQIDSLLANNSAKIRRIKFTNSVKIIKDNIFTGVGFNNFNSVYPLYHDAMIKDKFYTAKYSLGNLHNELLQFIVEFGLLGFLLIILVIFGYYKTFSHILFRKKQDYLINIGIFTSLNILFINSLFSSTFHHPTYIFLLLFFLAFLLNCINSDSYSIKKNRLYSIIFIMLTTFSGYIIISKYKSDKNLKKAILYEQQSKLKKAWNYANKALNPFANNAYYLFNINRIGYTYYLKNKDILPRLKQINELTLRFLPNHYLPNLVKILIMFDIKDNELKKLSKNEIKKFLTITPDRYLKDSYRILANIYILKKDKKNALLYFRKLLKLNPDAKEIKERIEWLENNL